MGDGAAKLFETTRAIHLTQIKHGSSQLVEYDCCVKTISTARNLLTQTHEMREVKAAERKKVLKRMQEQRREAYKRFNSKMQGNSE